MSVIEELGRRLAAPGLDDLVLRVHAARNELFELLEKEKSGKGFFGRGNEFREQVSRARAEYARAEAELERVRCEHTGLVALASLLAAHIQSGRDTSVLEGVLARALGVEDPVEVVPADEVPAKDGVDRPLAEGPETGTFTVLEVRPGRSPGTIRAYCEAEGGVKYAVFAKHSAGQVLAGAVGRKVVVKYRPGDRGLIALSVQVA